MIQIKHFTFNALREHCYIVWGEDKTCAVVDPGASVPAEQEELAAALKENDLHPGAILLTHGHFDHFAGVSYLLKQYPCPVYMHPDDRQTVRIFSSHAPLYGCTVPDSDFPTEDISDGQTLRIGQMEFQVIHTPGHSPGGVCYYCPAENIIFTGDTLFAGTIGRTDLPLSEYDDLIRSVMEKIMPLPADTDIIPGHGPASDIAFERTHNPFLIPFNAKDPETGEVEGFYTR